MIDAGRGIVFVRNDGQILQFLNSKARKLHNNNKKPSKIGWTTAYRKLHKRDRVNEKMKRKKRSNVKSTLRSYVAISPEEVIRHKVCKKSHKISLGEKL